MISDEMLMAYVDGQLAEGDRKRVETYLAADPEARDRLQVFVDTGPALARALDAATARPIPSWLIEAVLGSSGAAENAIGSRRVETSTARLATGRTIKTSPAGGFTAGGLKAVIGRGFSDLWPVAAAACAAMLVGAGIGWNLHMNGAPASSQQLIVAGADGQLQAGAALQNVLETAASGKATVLAGFHGEALATPVLSFESRDTGVCRQYRLSMSATVSTTASTGYEGIACRMAGGAWRIDVHTPAAVPRASSDRIAPASGQGDSLVDAVVDRLIAGDPFSRDEEDQRLLKNWKPQSSLGKSSPDRSGGNPATGQ